MSIVALKKKMVAKMNQSGNHSQFSLNGTYRNQGFIGQTSVYRNLPRTFLKNNAPKGYGGNYARISPKIVSFGGLGTLVENNRVVKSSVLSYNGMIASKYKWLKRPAPYITVKEDPSLECSVYTDELAKNTFLTIEKNCPTTLLTYYNNPPTACSANTPPIKTFLSSNPLNRKKRNCNVIKPNYLITSLSQSEYLRNIGGICKLTLPTGTNPYINISFDNNTADAGTLKSAPIFQSPAITPTYSTDVALTNYNNSAQPVLTKSLAFNSNNPLMILAPSTAPNTPSAPAFSFAGGMTFTFYIKTGTSTNTSGHRIFYANETTAGGRVFSISLNYGHLSVGDETSATILNSTRLINDNLWHKIDVVIITNTAKIFIDRTLDAYSTQLSFPLMIGTYSGGTGMFQTISNQSFVGYIQNMKIYTEPHVEYDLYNTNVAGSVGSLLSSLVSAPYISTYGTYEAKNYTPLTATWTDTSPNVRNIVVADPTITNATIITTTPASTTQLINNNIDTTTTSMTTLNLMDYSALSFAQLLNTDLLANYTIFYVSRQ